MSETSETSETSGNLQKFKFCVNEASYGHILKNCQNIDLYVSEAMKASKTSETSKVSKGNHLCP